MSKFSYIDIDSAYSRIKSNILKTPLITNEDINNITEANVYFKLENLQWTGSFKLRGAFNKILKLTSNQKKKGIVAYSSGNHAQAVAYACMINKIKATIIMPKNAPLIKINNTKKYGAEIVLYDPKIENRENIGYKLVKDKGLILVRPYDDLDVIAGQGTSGKEIAEDLINLNIIPDVYLCCCGGGGLIAGSSTYLKYKFPKIRCYSVEPEYFNDTQISLAKRTITSVKNGSYSICDALLAYQPGNITFPINQKILKSGLSVNDNQVKKTIIKLAEYLKIITEPGGAVAATALFNKQIKTKNKTIIVMISGGNIDNSFFSKIVKDS